jgi:hypothetical protein
MVQKITLFEPHFDGAQFGPSVMGGEGEDIEELVEDAAESTDIEVSGDIEESASGGSRLRRVFTFVVMAGIATAVGRMAFRRFGGDESDTLEFEDDEATEEPAIQ